MALYAFVASVMCLSWLVLFPYFRGRPRLLEADIEPTSFSRECLRVWPGTVAYPLVGVAGWAFNPLIAL